jgi:hypothetical protein
MISHIKSIIDDALDKTIVNIVYSNNNQTWNKFFTCNSSYTNRPLLRNPIFFEAYNFITEKVEKIYYGHITYYEYDTDENRISSKTYDIVPANLAQMNKNYFKAVKEILSPNQLKIVEESFQDHTQLKNLESVYFMLKLIRKNVFIKDYEEEHFTLETLKLFANKDINLETKKIMLILGIFDVNKVKDLDYCKEQMMKLIRKHVEKEKSALDKEFAEFNQDTESVSDEVSSIKEFLDTVAEDYSIFKDQEIPKDLILYCWPPILAPNPFISFIQSENY